MRLKLYRAPTMADAMSCVRRELGAEALILSTRRVAGGVEITAALEPSEAGEPGQAGPGGVAHRAASPVSEPPPRNAPTRATHPGGPERDAFERVLGADAGRGTPEIVQQAGHVGAGAAESGSRRQEERAALLAFHGVPPAIARRISAAPLAFALAAAFRFLACPIADDASPLLVAGPPGAGKTLTVARLASRLVLHGTAPLVITADGQRAGATEQLAAFTRLLGLDLIVACTPPMLARALGRREAGAPVLIDAPGTDAFDPSQQNAIHDLAAMANATTALVLPAGLDAAEAGEIAASHRLTGATLLIANRLDGARRLGGILSAAATGLAMVEAGIGPGAADGLVPLTPEFLAERLSRQKGSPG